MLVEIDHREYSKSFSLPKTNQSKVLIAAIAIMFKAAGAPMRRNHCSYIAAGYFLTKFSKHLHALLINE